MKFQIVAEFFEEISQHSSRLVITELLAQLYKKATAHEAKIITYLSLGALEAPYKNIQFNLADKSVTKVLAALFDVSEATIKNHARQTGDLGSVILLFADQFQDNKKITLLEVYEQLTELASLAGAGSQEEKAKKLLKMLASADPLSAQFIIRIVLGKLRLGFSDMTIIDALSWMLTDNKSLHARIEHAYNVCADLGHIAFVLKEHGVEGLDDVSIIVGTPIRPAAAERLPTAQEVFDKLGPCIAQPKLDGFRLQIHVDNRRGKKNRSFFSRNLIDMSTMFPDLVKDLDTLAVETLIAEGEAIVYNEETGDFAPFQETVKRKRKHGVQEAAQALPIKLFIFDILYLNGESLLNKSHETRRTILEKVFHKEHACAISVIDEKKITSAPQLEQYFLEMIEQGLEGLVVKKPTSHYQPGKRNFNWIKLKRQSHGELEDTIDCVILGYYFGHGKRAEFGIGAFLVGLYNDKKDWFETVAKIGTGLKDHEWIELKKKCDKLRILYQPNNVVCPKELVPDIWTSIELVCEVRADEITISPLHTAGKTEHELGYALRFPRFVHYRTDKKPTQATTVKELIEMFKHQKQRPS